MPGYLSHTLLLSLLLCFHTECKAAFVVRQSHEHIATDRGKMRQGIFAHHYEGRLNHYPYRSRPFDWNDAARQSFIWLMVAIGEAGLGLLLLFSSNTGFELLGFLAIGIGIFTAVGTFLLAIVGLVTSSKHKKRYAIATLAILAVGAIIGAIVGNNQ